MREVLGWQWTSEIEAAFDALVADRRELFGEDPRVLVRFDFERRSGDLRLVAAGLYPGGTEPTAPLL